MVSLCQCSATATMVWVTEIVSSQFHHYFSLTHTKGAMPKTSRAYSIRIYMSHREEGESEPENLISLYKKIYINLNRSQAFRLMIGNRFWMFKLVIWLISYNSLLFCSCVVSFSALPGSSCWSWCMYVVWHTLYILSIHFILCRCQWAKSVDRLYIYCYIYKNKVIPVWK